MPARRPAPTPQDEVHGLREASPAEVLQQVFEEHIRHQFKLEVSL